MYNTIIFSASKHIAYNFKPLFLKDFSDLKKIISQEFYISTCQFRNFHRKKENVLSIENCFILDFDICLSIWKFIESIKDFKFFIHTTKSHQKEKNGIMCDRFRMYFFCKHLRISLHEYEILLKHLCSILNSDIQASNIAMPFHGYKDALFYENENGILWDAEAYAKKNNIFNIASVKTYTSKNHKYDKNHFLNKEFWNRMFKPQEIYDGNRNASFARILLWARDTGCDSFEAEKIMNWLNSEISNPLSHKEIYALLKSKFKDRL